MGLEVELIGLLTNVGEGLLAQHLLGCALHKAGEAQLHSLGLAGQVADAEDGCLFVLLPKPNKRGPLPPSACANY